MKQKEYNIGDKVIFTNDFGDELDAVIIEKEVMTSNHIEYTINTQYGIPRKKFINGKGLKAYVDNN